MAPELSVVIPVRNESPNIDELHRELSDTLGRWGRSYELLFVDERCDNVQREALETIFSGKAGGPWEVLGRFVAKRLPTRFVPLRFTDDGRRKRMWVEDLFDTSIEAIRGKDKSKEASMSNVFNQIHAADQVLATGRTQCSDKEFPFSLEGSHALYSRFSWEVA